MHIIRNVFRMIKVYTTIGENTKKKSEREKNSFPESPRYNRSRKQRINVFMKGRKIETKVLHPIAKTATVASVSILFSIKKHGFSCPLTYEYV